MKGSKINIEEYKQNDQEALNLNDHSLVSILEIPELGKILI